MIRCFEELRMLLHRFRETAKGVKHALYCLLGNRCCGLDRHDVIGSSRQRGTRLSSSMRPRFLSIPLRREE
jgi:hypothetical protein